MSTLPCTYCVKGSYTDSNGIKRRCFFCGGTGKLFERLCIECEQPLEADETHHEHCMRVLAAYHEMKGEDD